MNADELRALAGYQMTDAEKAAQVRSFAYGNAHMSNDEITMADIDTALQAIESKEPK